MSFFPHPNSHLCNLVTDTRVKNPCSKVETKGKLTNWGMAKRFMVSEYNGILLCHKKFRPVLSEKTQNNLYNMLKIQSHKVLINFDFPEL